SRFQLSPRVCPLGTSQITCTAPLERSTFFNLPSATKARRWPSGDEAPPLTFSVPVTLCAVSDPIGRIQRDRVPSVVVEYTTRWPSGDNDTELVFSGKPNSNRISEAGAAAGVRK